MILSNKNIAVLAFLSFGVSNLYAQKSDSILQQNIEVVRILKNNTSNKVSASHSDFLNHDAGNFLTNLPEIGGRRIAGSYATDPVLRGFKYEQLNIVNDGSLTSIQACPSRMDPPASQVNLNIVKEAEIYKGPYQFRFGNSFGGTINFVSIDPKFTEKPVFSGRLSTGYETNGYGTRNELITRLSNRKFNIDLFGSYQKADDYKDGNGNKVPSAFERYSMGSRVSYQWNESNITKAQITTNQARDVKFATGMMNLLKDNTWLYSLKHDMTFQDSIFKKLSLSSYLSEVDHTMGTPDMSMISRIKSRSGGGRAELKLQWNNNLLYTGTDFRHDGEKDVPQQKMEMPNHGSGHSMAMGHNNAWQNGQINRLGWFNEYQRHWGRNKITASYRLDYSHATANDPSHYFMMKYGDNLSANQTTHSFSFSYNRVLNQHQQITVLIGRGERSAGITERYINFFPLGNDNYQYIGNPLLKSEKNYQVDIVYSYKSDKLNFQADGFYSRLKDFISSQIAPDIKPTSMMSKGVRQITNIDNAYKAGIEGSVQWNITNYLRTEAGAAYTYAQNMSQDVPLSEIAPLETRLRLEGNFNNITLGAEMRYTGQQNRTNPLFGEFATKDFTLFNLDARIEVFKNFNVALQLRNIFNRAYTEYLNKTMYSSGYTQRFMSPGRNFSLTCSYIF
ncbi:TonB-dependent receptor [Elizabethkingia anophelis]|nr:TonB-dependent receptor [Elizabethkingia anophelis]MCT3695677.1 TonB-dependent receptor [Elizabethkingia anophelis]MCT3860233.1 TonB-dependent receptor [Elizabethkingia anophelis]MCT4312566.1 TonB-dependent receptor [Elizabethkingia anophelis]